VGLEVLTLALLGLSILVFRVTRRLRETGRELAQQLATQDAILNSVDSAIIGIGSRGSVLYSNPIAVALLGAWAARGTQLSCDEEVHGLAGDMKALVCDARAGGGASSVRKVQHAAEGRTRHYVIRASHTPTRDAAEEDARSPESTAHIVTVTDVTEAEEAALQRDEYDVRLGEASRLLAYAAISGGIVHEISQPLAAIRNYVYALKVSFNIRHVSAEYRAIADHLGEEVDRAIEVVRNVRNLGPANLQDGGVCDVQEVLAHSVRLATLGCSPSPPVIVCDGGSRALIAGSLPMVGQVIVNLLRNALSASSDAGRTGAEVAVRFHDHQAMILVADHGHGVSPEAAKSMFQPFSKSTRGGMGLGLAICQRIATSLGGSLSWENRQGGGAVFKFTVPLAKEGIVQ
jgi:C4-dicarboxylate-specific signal transduction histidine kinase